MNCSDLLIKWVEIIKHIIFSKKIRGKIVDQISVAKKLLLT